VHLDLNAQRGEAAMHKALASIEQCARIVLLEPESAKSLPDTATSKISVIFQSAKPLSSKPVPKSDVFEICVVGHLREVKDPFLASQASRLLSSDSRIVVTQIGQALNGEMKRLAQQEMNRNPRYKWLGERTHEQTQHCIARARLMILSSKAEGAPSVISEAVVNGTPVLATRIAATVGLLGNDYPGLFPVGDVRGLSALMVRAENDSEFYAELTNEIAGVAKKFSPELERNAIEELMATIQS
jgi:glycosyltransferase involved in cell wall biosynthesis